MKNSDHTSSENQMQTEKIFDFKWKQKSSYHSEAMRENWRKWLIEKYFDGEIESISELFNTDKKLKILDAGCGAGISSLLLFGKNLNKHNYLGIDISNSIDIAEEEFKKNEINGKFLKCDLTKIPSDLGNFDLIFSEGVLHHTDSVEESIGLLSQRLNVGGTLMFYIYKKKAPIREYTDDLVRNCISSMDPELAWEQLRGLTDFGRIIGELNIEIELEYPIPFFEIPAGKYNLQHLIYYKIFKAFYHESISLLEMQHINFDWYMPKNCHRHTVEEVQTMIKKNELEIKRLYVDDSGITISANKSN